MGQYAHGRDVLISRDWSQAEMEVHYVQARSATSLLEDVKSNPYDNSHMDYVEEP